MTRLLIAIAVAELVALTALLWWHGQTSAALDEREHDINASRKDFDEIAAHLDRTVRELNWIRRQRDRCRDRCRWLQDECNRLHDELVTRPAPPDPPEPTAELDLSGDPQ